MAIIHEVSHRRIIYVDCVHEVGEVEKFDGDITAGYIVLSIHPKREVLDEVWVKLSSLSGTRPEIGVVNQVLKFRSHIIFLGVEYLMKYHYNVDEEYDRKYY